jgi:hypothetical protein
VVWAILVLMMESGYLGKMCEMESLQIHSGEEAEASHPRGYPEENFGGHCTKGIVVAGMFVQLITAAEVTYFADNPPKLSRTLEEILLCISLQKSSPRQSFNEDLERA